MKKTINKDKMVIKELTRKLKEALDLIEKYKIFIDRYVEKVVLTKKSK